MIRGLSEERLALFHVSRESMLRLEAYAALLMQWQTRINLIGASTADELWERHIADSLQLLPLIGTASPSLADLGSGAGLPGLVLSIAASARADLYESNGKKAAFLREAIRVTGASAKVHQIRIETLAGTPLPRVPTHVVARALAPLDTLLGWAAPFLRRGSIGLFHKGRSLEAELTAAKRLFDAEFILHPSQIGGDGAIVEVRMPRL